MRKRAPMLVASLAMAGVVASVALAAPLSADSTTGPKLDKLHAARPTAASNLPSQSTQSANVVPAGAVAEEQIREIVAFSHARAMLLTAYLNQLAFQAYLDGLTASAEASTVSTPPPPATSSYSSYSSDPGDFLSCVRNRESSGDYSAVNGSSGAAGAYQFLQGTWDSIAASIGRGDLVGVNPAQASPADQDMMAQALYAQQGAAPWGGGCS
jgi:muramidase (phage lysozyme)